MGVSRQEYGSRLSYPLPGDLPNPGTEPRSALQADSLPSEPPGKPRVTQSKGEIWDLNPDSSLNLVLFLKKLKYS